MFAILSSMQKLHGEQILFSPVTLRCIFKIKVFSPFITLKGDNAKCHVCIFSICTILYFWLSYPCTIPNHFCFSKPLKWIACLFPAKFWIFSHCKWLVIIETEYSVMSLFITGHHFLKNASLLFVCWIHITRERHP